MALLACTVTQYRTFDHTYVIKCKNRLRLQVTILDICKNTVFKCTVSGKELDKHNVEILLENPYVLLESLIGRKIVPSEYHPGENRLPREQIMQATEEAIQQFKPHVYAEASAREKYLCPITGIVFSEPVKDDCGHTFEKNAIDGWMGMGNTCPISHSPIGSLTLDKALQQEIAQLQHQDNIPTLSHLAKENPKKASKHLLAVQKLAKKKKYKKAVEEYKKVLKHTNRWEDYVELPGLFDEIGEKNKAYLARLNLAYYQLRSRQTDQAMQALEQCQESIPCFSIALFLIKLYDAEGQHQKSLEMTLALAETLPEDHPEQAISLFKEVLKQNPRQFALYHHLARLVDDPQIRAHFLLQGALHALADEDYAAAQPLCQDAGDQATERFLDARVSLDLLQHIEDPSAKIERLLSLANTYKEAGLFTEMIKAYKMLFLIEEREEYLQEIAAGYGQLEKPAKQALWASGASSSSSSSPAVPEMAFGKQAWETYFGKIGVEPALPDDIEEILDSLCPFALAQGEEIVIRDRYQLVLVPKSVEGEPLTLFLLDELMRSPITGPDIKYSGFSSHVKKAYGNNLAPPSHWILVASNTLVESREQPYADKRKIATAHPNFKLPPALDVVVAAATHFVASEECLYSHDPQVHVICKEMVQDNWPVVVGDFRPKASKLHDNGIDVTAFKLNFDSMGIAPYRAF